MPVGAHRLAERVSELADERPDLVLREIGSRGRMYLIAGEHNRLLPDRGCGGFNCNVNEIAWPTSFQKPMPVMPG